ncbi:MULTISPECIES: DUF3500 domain-containing protein [unclassified Spirosoma]|uniref:DUF3500 domain-containing protein n=1 Tax=unclassified Spirosoma TaxID=2621999 RepID=UPI00095ACCE9|nr:MULTISPECIES: DUF3500 domain-containing protein [unclassified Spirosoma]MBN8824774.1 DUF3500 domain-containing protein [Spirosoma sp.]OJW77071.1 MAG: hypothetical protein BGO59_23790 [Spirosoma sp. 48-14]
MKHVFFLVGCLLAGHLHVSGQVAPSPSTRPVQQRTKDEMTNAARTFLAMLTPEQKQKATFAFGDEERFNWHFVPRTRKGLPLKEMTAEQRKAAMELLKTGLSVQGYEKVTSIIDMENVLRVIDNRPPNDTYRDPENYSFTVFGDPSSKDPWGWRIEGHHLSLNFSSADGKALAYTPTFFGSNPGVLQYDTQMADKRMSDPRVKDLPQKGREILKPETERAFALLKTLSDDQRKQAILDPVAYPEIVTSNKRKASLEKMDGLTYADMNAQQKKLFKDLLQAYLAAYRITLAKQQMDKLEKAGLDNLRFAWAGDLTPELGAGKGWYYRIHGPTILIEYDNTQTNANHIHTVVRDLTNDWGEDVLGEHYQNTSHK